MNKDVKFIAVDVEASGPTPANYSLLSIGAREVGGSKRTFYRELKPISMNYDINAMLIGCKGIRILDKLRAEKYQPGGPLNEHLNLEKPDLFDPKAVLRKLRRYGTKPKTAMSQFKDWIIESSNEARPILASDCPAFDGMYVHFYFDKFKVDNPFGYGGVSIDSMYRGLVRNPSAQIEASEFWIEALSHNAVEDAIVQAEALEKIIQVMKDKNE